MLESLFTVAGSGCWRVACRYKKSVAIKLWNGHDSSASVLFHPPYWFSVVIFSYSDIDLLFIFI
jgi:hypothetical protein